MLADILAMAHERARALIPARQRLERDASRRPPPPDFSSALVGDRMGVIAEVKRRSPSAGNINPQLDPVAHARAYAAAGASAISVLTDEAHFGGSLLDLETVSSKVGIPLLRKDFIVSEEQLLEARASGASAALLIVRALSTDRLESLIAFASGLELASLVEVHTADELAVALDAGALVIGVNSRDLDSFTVDVDRALELVHRVPPDRIAVAESGIRNPADVGRAALAGADAVLAGTVLSAAAQPGTLVRAMREVERRGR
jgi:indole-3-glycerol phosphate synthase